MRSNNGPTMRDLYTPEVVIRIGHKIGLTSPDQLDPLGIALCNIAERYIVIQDEVALEEKDRDRAKWIEKNLLRPAKHLRERLWLPRPAKYPRERLSLPEYDRMWSKWPDEKFDDSLPKLKRWSQALDDIASPGLQTVLALV